ncbi:NDR1/HIN1-like protein 26 [Salvia miltiorrhiza]|uniref:NDR1/HIN1-like protein 26 n=1 Tax=Salvia miltiorrhiza TaxID=226208 RepID=UPI0025ABE3D1|nr:NDR1/HIN1-like protein 26 [Salvia miltiorrhiza]
MMSRPEKEAMWPEQHIPIEPANGINRPVKRHHSAHYYAHRVKESLTRRATKIFCAVFLTLFIVVCVAAFILWLSLRPHRPRFHVQEFSIPAFAQEAGFNNAAIIYNATARNANQIMGVYYDSVQLAVYYQENIIGGSPVLFPLYQKPKTTTVINGQLSGATLRVSEQRWQQFVADLGKGEVVFRLDISSTIRFRIWKWHSKRHKMHAHCPVGVGPDGFILPHYRDKRCPLYFS